MSATRKIYTGLVLLGSSFLFACSSSNPSLYPVKMTGRYGYISKAGKVAINPQFDDVGRFAEGLAPVKFGTKWGDIDREGKLAINPQFAVADPFSGGVALIGTNMRFGDIDKAGKIS